jgi:hypothetical protein
MNYEFAGAYGDTPLPPDDQKFVDRYMMDTYKNALSTVGVGMVLLIIVASILYKKF